MLSYLTLALTTIFISDIENRLPTLFLSIVNILFIIPGIQYDFTKYLVAIFISLFYIIRVKYDLPTSVSDVKEIV